MCKFRKDAVSTTQIGFFLDVAYHHTLSDELVADQVNDQVKLAQRLSSSAVEGLHEPGPFSGYIGPGGPHNFLSRCVCGPS